MNHNNQELINNLKGVLQVHVMKKHPQLILRTNSINNSYIIKIIIWLESKAI